MEIQHLLKLPNTEIFAKYKTTFRMNAHKWSYSLYFNLYLFQITAFLALNCFFHKYFNVLCIFICTCHNLIFSWEFRPPLLIRQTILQPFVWEIINIVRCSKFHLKKEYTENKKRKKSTKMHNSNKQGLTNAVANGDQVFFYLVTNVI